MSEIIKKYIKQRQDLGESGFWIDPNESKKKSSENKNKSSHKINKGLSSLEKEVLKCQKCDLGKYRLNPCFGNGSETAKLMFIGEGPGFQEDHEGRVFIGRAGKLLDKTLKKIADINREDVYITNIVKCHPMKDPTDPEKHSNDRAPSPAETAECINYLFQQIKIIDPDLIVTLGSPASKTILQTSDTITSLHGKIFKKEISAKVFNILPVFHPAYILRNPPKITEFEADFELIKSLMCNT